MEPQPEPEVFRLTDPWCSCGRPWGLPCFGPVPQEYYSNIDFATAAWARSQYCDQEVHHELLIVYYVESETLLKLSKLITRNHS